MGRERGFQFKYTSIPTFFVGEKHSHMLSSHLHQDEAYSPKEGENGTKDCQMLPKGRPTNYAELQAIRSHSFFATKLRIEHRSIFHTMFTFMSGTSSASEFPSTMNSGNLVSFLKV